MAVGDAVDPDVFPRKVLLAWVAINERGTLVNGVATSDELTSVKLLFVDKGTLKMKLGIEDPTNELLIEKVMTYMAPYTVEFMLIDPGSTAIH